MNPRWLFRSSCLSDVDASDASSAPRGTFASKGPSASSAKEQEGQQEVCGDGAGVEEPAGAAESEGAEEVVDMALEEAPRQQAMTLLLFEEVDLLPDEDRGFAAAVAQMVAESKRPILLTANSADHIHPQLAVIWPGAHVN